MGREKTQEGEKKEKKTLTSFHLWVREPGLLQGVEKFVLIWRWEKQTLLSSFSHSACPPCDPCPVWRTVDSVSNVGVRLVPALSNQFSVHIFLVGIKYVLSPVVLLKGREEAKEPFTSDNISAACLKYLLLGKGRNGQTFLVEGCVHAHCLCAWGEFCGRAETG